jgi:hypothetical protein
MSLDPTGAWTIYPGREPRILRIVNKIIRGLSCYHNLRWPLSDRDVLCTLWPYQSDPGFDVAWDWNVIRAGVFDYSFATDVDRDCESLWALSFFGRVNFLGCVQRAVLSPTD